MPQLPEVSHNYFDIDRVGIIRIIEGHAPKAILAEVWDGPEIPGFRHYFSEDCSLYIREARCDGCSRHAVDVGSIVVRGLKVPLQFDPGIGYSAHPYPAAGTDLFAPGDLITFDAPGRVGAGFSVELAGVPPIEGPPAEIAYDGTSRVDVRWTAADAARVALIVPIGDRTKPPEALMRCESNDDGLITIDRGLTLPQPSTTAPQWPPTMMRFNRTAVSAPGGYLEFEVGHEVEVAVRR